MPMNKSYAEDTAWTGPREADTKGEIAKGNRTSTLRPASEITRAQSEGRGYEVGKIYSTSGSAPYVRITSIENLGPANLVSPERWQQISKTERWSADYLMAAAGAEVTTKNTKISAAPSAPAAPAQEPRNIADRVAALLNEFADIRTKTAAQAGFTGGIRYHKYGTGDKATVTSQIDRAVGSMGAFGKFHDSDRAPSGVDLKRTIPARVADIAAQFKVDVTDEFFDGKFVATQKTVAEVFHDMFVALRAVRYDPAIIDPSTRAEISALMLEMSRILHDYSTPRSRAIFQNMWKRSRGVGASKFGLTANAAEIAAQGVEMPSDVKPGIKAKLQRVAAAQVGQVPQASLGDEPSVTRSLADEISGRGRGSEVVSELQRHVDQNGVFEGSGDVARVDLYGRVAYDGPADPSIARRTRNMSQSLGAFLESPIGFMADGVLDMRQHFFDQRLKLTPLENRGEYASPIQLRTNFRYKSGVKPEDRVDMQLIVDAFKRATDSVAGKLVYADFGEGATIKVPDAAQEKMRQDLAAWTAARNELAKTQGADFADTYMQSQEGILRFGKKPVVVSTVDVKGIMVMPEAVAAELMSSNQEMADSFRKLPEGFKIEFVPVVSPKYIVLKNGSVVSARSSEAGVIQHRRVLPFKVSKVNGEISVEQLDSQQTTVTDPNQRYNRDQAKETERKFLEVFGGYYRNQKIDVPGEFNPSLSETPQGFNDQSSGPLLEQVVEDVRTDAYAALETLAINGDRFPALESELIGTILEFGDFRPDRAPTYVKARQGVVEQTGTVGLGTMKGPVMSPSEAFSLPRSILDLTGVTDGDMSDILNSPDRFGANAPEGITTETQNLAAIVRGLRLMQKMSSVAAVQLGYGGIRVKPARLENPKSGEIRLFDRDPFWMLADKEVYTDAATATEPATLAAEGLSQLESNAIINGGEETEKAVAAINETTKAAVLAARASVESAKGLLGDNWSVDLDPQIHRNRFPVRIDTTRRIADATFYPYMRLMDSIGAPTDQRIINGGSLYAMRTSGALSSKSDKFFADLQKAGITIGVQQEPPGGELTRTTTEMGQTKTYTWDPEMGWMVEKQGAAIGEGFVREKVTSLTPAEEEALTVEMINKMREWIVGQPTPMARPDQEVILQGQEPAQFKTVETRQGTGAAAKKANKISNDKFKKVIASGAVREIFTSMDVAELRRKQQFDLFQKLGEAAGIPEAQRIPEGSVRIAKPDGSVETLSIEEFRKRADEERRKKGRAKQFDAADGMEIAGPEDFGYSVFDEQSLPNDMAVDDIGPDEPIVRQTIGRSQVRQLASAVAIALTNNEGANSGEERVHAVLDEFKSQLGTIDSQKKLDGLFRKFWKEYSDVTVGRSYAKSRELVRAIGSNMPDSYVERALALNLEVANKPAMAVVSRNLEGGPEEAIVVRKKGKKLVNAELVIPILEGMQESSLKADQEIARPIYKFFAEYFGIKVPTIKINNKQEVKLPRLESGPMSKQVDIAIRAIKMGEIPEVETGPIKESSDVKVRMDISGQPQAPSVSATGRPKQTTVDVTDYSPEDYDGGYFDGSDPLNPEIGSSNGESEVNYAVRQGKLLGLLQPDRLVPKMSPNLRSIDMGIRTPMGGSVAGAALDLGTMAFSGNLTPQNALFTTALNATSLLSKSPLKSTAIGAAASLGATAATGGDIGRTIFNLLGSIGGGIVGGVASGGLGSFGGSVAGGFVGDELWKALFNKSGDWTVYKKPTVTTPELKVRVP